MTDNMVLGYGPGSSQCNQYSCVQSQVTLSAGVRMVENNIFLLVILATIGPGSASYYYYDDSYDDYTSGSEMDTGKIMVMVIVGIVLMILACIWACIKRKRKEAIRNGMRQTEGGTPGTTVALTETRSTTRVTGSMLRYTDPVTSFRNSPFNTHIDPPARQSPQRLSATTQHTNPPQFRYTDPVASFRNSPFSTYADLPARQSAQNLRATTQHTNPPPFRYTDPVTSFESGRANEQTNGSISTYNLDPPSYGQVDAVAPPLSNEDNPPPPYRHTDPVTSFPTRDTSPTHVPTEPPPPSYDSLFTEYNSQSENRTAVCHAENE